MKNTAKKAMVMILMVISLFAFAGTAMAGQKVKMNKKKAVITAGQQTVLVLKGAKAKKVKWSSSRKNVATVNKKGVVTGKKKGSAVITAKYKGKKYKAKITVKAAAVKPSQAAQAAQKPYKNAWVFNGDIGATSVWMNLAFCNQQTAQNMVKARPYSLEYDTNGNLVANIAVLNQTPSRNYYLKDMYVNISVGNNAVAEGYFTWNNFYINPMTYEIVKVTFDQGGTKQIVDLTKYATNFAIETN